MMKEGTADEQSLLFCPVAQVSPGAAQNSLTQDSPGDHAFGNLPSKFRPCITLFSFHEKASRHLMGIMLPMPSFG